MINQRLPPELIRVVLEQSIPDDLEDCRPGVTAAPLQLLPVCRMWRDIALTTSILWSSIHFEYKWKSDRSHNAVVLGLRKWFKRGQNCPLRIRAQVEEDRLKWSGLMNVFTSSSSVSRWEVLHLVSPKTQLQSLLACPTPTLKELVLSFFQHSSALMLDLARFPALRRLEVTAKDVPTIIVYVIYQYTPEFKYVFLEAKISQDDLQHIINRSPQLEELVFLGKTILPGKYPTRREELLASTT